jgi:acetylornithine deacetylase/succinyl-diaminopimelate desuccinylase-like protein
VNYVRLVAGFVALTLPCLGTADPDWNKVETQSVQILQRYIRIASVNPPADTSQAAQFLKEQLASVGIEANLYSPGVEKKTNLLARLPGRDHSLKPLVLLNHMDVVPVDASRWKEDPFGAQIKDGQIWGRGSLDMKSTAVLQLMSLMLLKQLGIVPPRDIVFLSVCDEETSGKEGAKWMIEHRWNELNPEYVLDEGGVGSTDIYSPGKLLFGVSAADKQVLWLKMRAEGTSGHGSQPIPDNANDLLIEAIAKAKAFPPSGKNSQVLEIMKEKIGTFASNKFINAIQRNTMSITTLRSGVGDPPKANVIPSVAEATLDCRLLPGQNADEFISEIKARVNDPRISIEMVSEKPDDAQPSPVDTKLFQAIESAIKKQHPTSSVTPIIVPFGTDGQKFRMRHVPAYGIMPMIIDAKTLATMHSDSEHVPIDQFRAGLHIYFDVLRSNW